MKPPFQETLYSQPQYIKYKSQGALTEMELLAWPNPPKLL